MAACDISRVVAAGTKLFAKFYGEGNYTQVGGVVSLGGPEMSAENIDATELDPYAGGTIPALPEFWKQFMAGWRDAGQVTLVLNLTVAEYVRWKVPFARGQNADFYIQLRNGLQIPFCGFTNAFGQTHEIGGLVQTPLTVKLTGSAAAYTTTTT